MNDLIFYTAVAVLAIVPPILIWHAEYEDRILGRLSLGFTSLFSWVFIFEELVGDPWVVPIHFSLTFASFALFLLWHTLRFENRIIDQGGQTIGASLRDEFLRWTKCARQCFSAVKKWRKRRK